MSMRQPASNQQVKPHTTQQQDGGCVVKPQPKEDHNQFVFFHPSTERRLQLMENRRIRQLKDQYYHFVKRSNPPDHRDSVNFQGRKPPCNELPHSCQKPRATTNNWRARGEGDKISNGTQ
jgi:hypothetical protein